MLYSSQKQKHTSKSIIAERKKVFFPPKPPKKTFFLYRQKTHHTAKIEQATKHTTSPKNTPHRKNRASHQAHHIAKKHTTPQK
jgi:hypothetical protein